MKKKNCILSLLIILFILLQYGLVSGSVQTNIAKDALQYEVIVTLKLIQVYVTDKKGKPITDLKKSDFQLFDNNELVKITDFEKHILLVPKEKTKKIQSNVSPEIPASLNRKFFLFFDFAFNDAGGILKAKKAALHFIDTQLHPTDEVGVISYDTNKGLTLHEYITSDHLKSREVIQGFGLKEFLGRAQDIEFRYWEDREEFVKKIKRTNKEIYKAQVLNFSKELKDFAKSLRYIPGSKYVILFSSGVANSVLYGEQKEIINWPYDIGDASLRILYEKMSEELASSNCLVFAVNTAGLGTAHFRDRDMMGDHSLNQLVRLSGGKYFDNIVSYEEIMGEIQDLTSVYYVLGYYIDEKWDGKYHKIMVKVKRKGCQVHGQVGYFNPKPFTEYTEFEKLLHLIDLALSEKPHLQEPLHFSSIALPFSIKQKPNLVILSKIPGEIAKKVLGREVEVVTLIFDGRNNIVDLKTEKVSASKLTQNAVYYYSTLSLSPGEYDCRIVIRNLETGKGAVGSSSVTISR